MKCNRKRRMWFAHGWVGHGFALVAVLAIAGCRTEQPAWRESFPVDKADLTATGGNALFSLQPGAQSRYRSGDATLTITVLDETRVVDGVETRIVEEREEVNGVPIEVSRNFFAIDQTTNDVYYFGEEVDIYENGEVVSHEGAWLSGVQGARFGLMIPGTIQLGDRYYQEIAPQVAMDRAEIVAADETVETPAGTFAHCVRIEETTPLEAGRSHKWYAAGVGLVQDAEFVLVQYVAPPA